MLYGKYHYYCRFESEAVLPFYKGSTFRGVFGRALKKVVCALRKQECSQCLLKQRCVYALVFETPDAVLAPGSKISAVPHPFVIEPPLTTETMFSEGSSFDFSLILFGGVNHSLPYFVYAFEQMGRIGIGKRVKGKRGNFTLKKVKHGGQTLYSDDDRKLNAVDSQEFLSVPEKNDCREGGTRLKLDLETPLRIKYENRLKADLPFHVLVRAMLRRVSSLLNCYGNGEPLLDYKSLVKRAREVSIAESDLQWFDWKRYSHRQDKSMLMGGLVGSILYEGNIGEFIPLFDFSAKAHIGKQTAFGLGKITWEILP